MAFNKRLIIDIEGCGHCHLKTNNPLLLESITTACDKTPPVIMRLRVANIYATLRHYFYRRYVPLPNDMCDIICT